jgi:hypothetical protein
MDTFFIALLFIGASYYLAKQVYYMFTKPDTTGCGGACTKCAAGKSFDTIQN